MLYQIRAHVQKWIWVSSWNLYTGLVDHESPSFLSIQPVAGVRQSAPSFTLHVAHIVIILLVYFAAIYWALEPLARECTSIAPSSYHLRLQANPHYALTRFHSLHSIMDLFTCPFSVELSSFSMSRYCFLRASRWTRNDTAYFRSTMLPLFNGMSETI